VKIAYVEPLQRAWARTRLTLFAPLDLAKWLVLAFSAWLAGLVDGVGGGAPSGRIRSGHGADFVGGLYSLQEWFAQHPWLVPLVVAAIVAGALLLVVLLWLSSRGKFIFLDNVVHNRAAIVEPWGRYRRLGNSLFLWRLGFFAVAIAVLAALAGVLLLVAGGVAGFTVATVRGTVAIALGVLAALFSIVALACVALFLDSFVVPVMARTELGAAAAWRLLLPWFEAYLGAFLGYALFVLALGLAVGVAVVVFGLLTCCVGFLLLAIPYVGTVLLLPVFVTYRAFSLEFLAQFDPAFQLFPPATPSQPPPMGGDSRRLDSSP